MTPISTVEEKTINSFVGSIIIIELQPKLFTSLRMCDICVYSNRIAVALFHHSYTHWFMRILLHCENCIPK